MRYRARGSGPGCRHLRRESPPLLAASAQNSPLVTLSVLVVRILRQSWPGPVGLACRRRALEVLSGESCHKLKKLSGHLFRRSMPGVRPVLRNPYRQVSVQPDVRHRCLSTVLFGLATLQLINLISDLQQPVSHTGFGATVLNYGVTALFAAVWLVGAAAVWLLWRPASSAFFKPQGFTQAGLSAQPSSRVRSSSALLPRHL
jgi:hypothetical protein